MSRAVLGLAGVVLEAGCVWIWVMSPQLTAIYNAEFTSAFFARIPGLQELVDAALGALGSIGEPTQDVNGMVARLELGFGLMIVGYVAALVTLGAVGGERGVGWLLLGFAAVFRLTLVMLPGLFSTDIFSYVMYGRITAIYGQNPYVLAPNGFPNDPFLAWVFPFWRDQPTVYGAAWTDFSGLLSRLTGQLSNFDQVMAYRLSLGVLELAALGLVWWLLGKLRPDDGSSGARMTAWTLYAWNPLVLFDLVGSAHNDVAMLALLLAGVALVASRPRGTWLWGIVAITLSALVKYATGVVVLLWVAAWAAQGGSMRGRLRRVCLGLGGPLAVAVIMWWPWIQTAQAFVPLSEAAGGHLVINSAPDLVALTVADQLLEPAGMDPETAQAAARFFARAVTRVIFAVYLVWELHRLWVLAAQRNRSTANGARVVPRATIEASTRVLLVLPLLVMTWVWSWYFSWSLVLATLLGWRSRLARLVVAYTLSALLVVYAHQYLNERLSGAFVLALALVPLVCLLPGPAWRQSVARRSS